jgi:hypothetical protein
MDAATTLVRVHDLPPVPTAAERTMERDTGLDL